MRELSGGLIQNETANQETSDSEPSLIHATKTKNKEAVDGSHWFSWLNKISIGQYRTPLYY